jgi:alpha-galactosidase
MVSSGMRDAGYATLLSTTAGRCPGCGRTIVADSARFPTDQGRWRTTCTARVSSSASTRCRPQDLPGSPGTYGHEVQDARTYAAWGVDYVKEMGATPKAWWPRCSMRSIRGRAGARGRPIVLSICEWGANQPWDWAPKMGNSGATTDDISDNWPSMLSNLDHIKPTPG